MKQIADTTPFIIITGFLGSGKTTLLNRLLEADHGQQLAVIVNEFGAVNIDSQFIAENVGDGMVEMTNGCVCCTVREDLREGLIELLDKRREGKLTFTHIVMETTGLAKVGPIAQTLESREIKQELKLAGVVTLVDGFHVATQLKEFEEVPEQIGSADIILLNKSDLIDDQTCSELQQHLSQMNKGARILRCQNAEIDVSEITELQSGTISGQSFSDSGTSEHKHSDHQDHHHTEQVSSFVVRIIEPLDQGLVQDWFSYLIMRHAEKLLRYKGHLYIQDRPSRIIIQGVHSLVDSTTGANWKPGETAKTELVFIGKNLPEEDIRKGLHDCVVDSIQ